jgi:hypothetical protein
MKRFLSGHPVALALLAIAFHATAHGAEPSRYTIAPAPDWVLSAPPEAPAPADSTQKASGGTEYQLSDLQVRVDDTWSQYYRSVSRPTNPSGVSDSSNISIDFDPELDRLVLHAVTLRRGNTTIDELSQGRIEVLRRESKLESGILDGSLTFHLLMSDVRVGDLIEYSYTAPRSRLGKPLLCPLSAAVGGSDRPLTGQGAIPISRAALCLFPAGEGTAESR